MGDFFTTSGKALLAYGHAAIEGTRNWEGRSGTFPVLVTNVGSIHLPHQPNTSSHEVGGEACPSLLQLLPCELHDPGPQGGIDRDHLAERQQLQPIVPCLPEVLCGVGLEVITDDPAIALVPITAHGEQLFANGADLLIRHRPAHTRPGSAMSAAVRRVSAARLWLARGVAVSRKACCRKQASK